MYGALYIRESHSQLCVITLIRKRDNSENYILRNYCVLKRMGAILLVLTRRSISPVSLIYIEGKEMLYVRQSIYSLYIRQSQSSICISGSISSLYLIYKRERKRDSDIQREETLSHIKCLSLLSFY